MMTGLQFGMSEQLQQIAGLSEISGLDYWNGIVEWTTGMTFEDDYEKFAVKDAVK